MSGFEDFLKNEVQYSNHTIRAYMFDLNQYRQFALSTLSGLGVIDSSSRREFSGFVCWLSRKNYNPKSIHRKISAMRTFCRFMDIEKDVDHEKPHVDLPKRRNKVIQCWTVQQAVRVIEEPNRSDKNSTRDKAMMELLYSTGCRVSEIASMKRSLFESNPKMVRVIGKRDKERLVPIGKPAYKAVTDYISATKEHETPALFTVTGKRPIAPSTITKAVKKYADRANAKHGSSMAFRHSCATHMYEGGANLREIQTILGHKQLTTTTIYTHVSTKYKKEIYEKFHSRSGVEKKSNERAKTNEDLGDYQETRYGYKNPFWGR